MATNIRIVHAHDFLKATPKGLLDFEQSKRLLIEVAAAAASLAEYEVIVDTRKAETALSVTELWYLAAELSKSGEAFSRKTAVLCPLKDFDNAAFFALCAQNRGFRVQAFTSFEDAIEWLIANAS